jgi:hypothetical protein
MAFSPAPPNASTKPSAFNFPKGPVFGDLSSQPKSPKTAAIENPFLKNSSMGGGGGGSFRGGGFGSSRSSSTMRPMGTSNAFQTPNFQFTVPRDPLAPRPGGERNINLAGTPSLLQQPTLQKKPSAAAPPVPPPNMSLSLMEGFVMVSRVVWTRSCPTRAHFDLPNGVAIFNQH